MSCWRKVQAMCSNAFILASLDEYAEYEHLERIFMDAISDTSIEYSDDDEIVFISGKFVRYQSGDYAPVPHEYREE